jgi:hypothetical protein
MLEGQEAVDFHLSDCKKPNLSILHIRGQSSKCGRSPKCLHGNTFLRRRHTLEGTLGRTRTETQTTVERPLSFFHRKLKELLPLDFGLGVWSFTLRPSKSRGCGSSWPKVLDFGNSHYARPRTLIPIFYWLFSAHFFGLSTNFGHSFPWPLNLDSHSVKWPLNWDEWRTNL